MNDELEQLPGDESLEANDLPVIPQGVIKPTTDSAAIITPHPEGHVDEELAVPELSVQPSAGPSVSQPSAQQDAAVKRSPTAEQPVDHDESSVRFVGYSAPQKRGLGSFVWRNKVAVGASVFMITVVGAIGGLVFASTGGESAVSQSVNEQVSSSGESDTADDVLSEPEEPITTHISGVQFGLRDRGERYSLETLDGERWLERSGLDWRSFVAWEGWLFFTADRSGDGVRGSTVGLEAFRYTDAQYVSVGELSAPVEGSDALEIVEPLYLLNDWLYIRFSGSETAGAVYRCLLDVDTGCTGLELFYDGPGDVYIHSDEKLYVVSERSVEGAVVQTVSSYDTQSKELTEITQASRTDGVGLQFAQVARDEFVWMLEFAEIEQQPAEEDATDPQVIETQEQPRVRLAELRALNPDGGTAFVIPGNAVPLTNPQLVHTALVESNEILFANDEREVIFNTDTKQFDAPRERLITDESESIETLLDTEVRLAVPKEYLMRIPSQR